MAIHGQIASMSWNAVTAVECNYSAVPDKGGGRPLMMHSVGKRIRVWTAPQRREGWWSVKGG